MWRRITFRYPITQGRGAVIFLREYLRTLPQTMRDGCAALRYILLWGAVYPRTIDLPALRAMRKQP